MDCEKFEPLLLDELYGELPELTSASVRRHVSGCARCASILNGMRRTQELVETADLPSSDLPEGFEERILAHVREAQKVTPIHGRAQRALSLAGRWAMRPQTAMAAVFLLMIGSSAFLLRSRSARAPESAVSVTVAGEPGKAVAAADHDSLDDKAAAAAHGATPNAASPLATMTAAPAAPPMFANAERARAAESNDEGLGAKSKADDGEGTNEAPSGGYAAAAPAAMAADEAHAKAALGGSGAEAKKTADGAQDSFAAGMAAYRARNFSEATRLFDAAAAGGDTNAALWAAKSVRDGSGCSAALHRFTALSSNASGTWIGNEAAFDGANCQIAVGQTGDGRATLTRLLGVPSHQARARAALDELDQVAARRDASGPAKGSAAPAAKASSKSSAKPLPAKPAQTTDR